MILRQGNTLNVDNIFMQWNVPLIDKIIIDMSCCLLAVSIVTMVPMVTRRCELYFDQQCVWGADSAEFKTDPGSYRDMCIILLGNLSYLARIYTDHGKQAMLIACQACSM